LVKTADGYKAIARIRVGDRVFTKDETSGVTGYKPVTARYGNPYQETVYIEVSDGIGNSQTLISNRIHPFYSGGKWIKAEDLKAGIRLFAENSTEQTVQSVTIKPEPLQAYNLTVADWHTYFIIRRRIRLYPRKFFSPTGRLYKPTRISSPHHHTNPK